MTLKRRSVLSGKLKRTGGVSLLQTQQKNIGWFKFHSNGVGWFNGHVKPTNPFTPAQRTTNKIQMAPQTVVIVILYHICSECHEPLNTVGVVTYTLNAIVYEYDGGVIPSHLT